MVGIPDAECYNRPCLCVRRRRKDAVADAPDAAPDAADAAEVSAEQLLAVYAESLDQGPAGSGRMPGAALPKYCLFFRSFPRSWNGKLQRKKLRALACERLHVAVSD